MHIRTVCKWTKTVIQRSCDKLQFWFTFKLFEYALLVHIWSKTLSKSKTWYWALSNIFIPEIEPPGNPVSHLNVNVWQSVLGLLSDLQRDKHYYLLPKNFLIILLKMFLFCLFGQVESFVSNLFSKVIKFFAKFATKFEISGSTCFDQSYLKKLIFRFLEGMNRSMVNNIPNMSPTNWKSLIIRVVQDAYNCSENYGKFSQA